MKLYKVLLISLITFAIGWMLPSPLQLLRKVRSGKDAHIALMDTVNMILPDSSRYDGSIIVGSHKRHGFGTLTMKDGSVYEGNWRKDRLHYGQRTTASSVYNGRFDEQLNNEGFGIIEYNDQYIASKRKEGLVSSQIITKYIGNWSKNSKEGLGRSIMADGSMQFGRYEKGELQVVGRSKYRIGDKVYGIDISHHQPDINWDDLALYCDHKGKVSRDKAKDETYMQPIYFAYIKATEGATIKDDTYNVRSIEAERHGIVKGAYHFLHLGSSIDEQVINFVETAKWTKGDLPPALDIEVEKELKKYGVQQSAEMILTWLQKVEETMHVRPIIYTRKPIKDKYLNDRRFDAYSFWIARYSDKEPDTEWCIWQMTEKGTASGYTGGRIDINQFNGDYKAFMSFVDTLKVN